MAIYRRRRLAVSGLLGGLTMLLLLSAFGTPAAPVASSGPGRLPREGVRAAYGRLPLTFEPNVGQTAPRVDFLARGAGSALFLTADEAVFAWPAGAGMASAGRKVRPGLDPAPSTDKAARGSAGEEEPAAVPGRALRLQLVGADSKARAVGLDQLPGKVNYFRGNDPAQWRTDIPTYGRVQYAGVYPGIDLVYYGSPQQLEYDFVVAPGVDPAAITVRFLDADRVAVDAAGDVVVETAAGSLRQRKPVLYQEGPAGRQEIAGGYVLRGEREIAFAVGAYDASRPLILDPVVLVSSTYLGGSNNDVGQAVAVDAAGNVYVTGYTTGFPDPLGFPTTPGAFQPSFGGQTYDAFVTKLNSSGTALVYSTYLGGSGDDNGYGIAVDAQGNAYVTGLTASRNFPTTPGAFQPAFGGTAADLSADAFVTKLNPTGSALVYSTYLGGNDLDGGSGIAVDSAGNAYVTGFSARVAGIVTPPNFPTTPGAFQPAFGGPIFAEGEDAFVTKLNATGSALLYSTYLGGNGNDRGESIAVDTAGNAYVTGWTASSNFPTTPGAFDTSFGGGTCFNSPCFDAFVTKLNSTGTALVYSSYLGGSAEDRGRGIAVDAAGSAYVAGLAGSLNFPTTPGAFQPAFGGEQSDAFVTKLNAAGSALVYSTYLGGSSVDEAFSIALDAMGNAYVTGQTFSPDFPVTPGAFQPIRSGTQLPAVDAFVTMLNPAGTALIYSTYLGGSGFDRGQGIAVEAAGNAYVTGFTSSRDFPTTPGAFQSTLALSGCNGQDAFVSKLAQVTGSVTPIPTRASPPTCTTTPTATATATTTRTSTATPTSSATPTGTATSSATPTSTPTAPATPTPMSTPTPTITTATLTATSTPPVVPAQNAPSTTGQGPCASQVGQTCTVAGGATGTWTKTGSGTFRLTVTGPPTAAPGGTPRLFLPTTAGVETDLCTPLPAAAPFATTCAGTTVGDLLQGATVTVRFPIAGGGTQDVTSTVSGPGAIAPAAGVARAVVATAPLLPPLPPLPSLPPVVLPLPPPPLVAEPPARLAPSGRRPEVPVIPEADSIALLVLGLGALGALAACRWLRHGKLP